MVLSATDPNTLQEIGFYGAFSTNDVVAIGEGISLDVNGMDVASVPLAFRVLQGAKLIISPEQRLGWVGRSGFDPIVNAGKVELSGTLTDDHIFGTVGDDIVYGLQGSDNLIGGVGADLMFGGDGDDQMDGGRQSDSLDGGVGNDIFRFQSTADADGDTIMNFEAGDLLDLSFIDANGDAEGEGTFTLVTGGLTGAGQLSVTYEARDDGTYAVVEGSTTSAAPDFTLNVKTDLTLTTSDFGL